jgi:hypothetical protein
MNTTALNGYGILRSVLERARQEAGCSLGELTALSAQVDPYRLDTPAGHRDGQWLAEQLDKAIGKSRRIHWRGLHYVLVSSTRPLVKPNGEVYRNTEADWVWMTEVAGKAARWLGYIPFERISDNRNAAPVIHRRALVVPEAVVVTGLDVTLPDDIAPLPAAEGLEPRQAFHFLRREGEP